MNNDFQARLLDVIADRRISASELSRRSGVSKVAISNYINGVYLPKQDKVYLLAKALDVDPGWLMTGEEPTTPPPSEDDAPRTLEARLLVRGIDKMPKQQREAILNMMMGLYPGLFEEKGTDANETDA